MNSTPFYLLADGLPPYEFSDAGTHLITQIENPGSVATLCLALKSAIPENMACKKGILTRIGSLYYSVPPFTEFEYMTSVTNFNPTEIIHTGFPLNPHTNSVPSINVIVYTRLIIVRKPEDIEEVRNKAFGKIGPDLQRDYARKVAQNLYNFFLSFEKVTLLIIHRDPLMEKRKKSLSAQQTSLNAGMPSS